MLELPYRGQELAMLVILPRERDGLAAVEQLLTSDRLSAWVARLAGRAVEVSMPRFELTTSYDLVKPLTRLGMARAFAPPGPAGADFSGMCASDDPALQLFIQFVLHKAVVQVHEKGTVAAAATAVMMGVPGGSTPFTPKFVADHPFLFLICHRPSGSILFLGRLAEPEGAGATAP